MPVRQFLPSVKFRNIKAWRDDVCANQTSLLPPPIFVFQNGRISRYAQKASKLQVDLQIPLYILNSINQQISGTIGQLDMTLVLEELPHPSRKPFVGGSLPCLE
jgi:hypothetical protein